MCCSKQRQGFRNETLDANKKELHNLASLLLTNKTIRGAAPKVVLGRLVL
jgi:hypothetical protein